jgi:hypothetical protein
VVRRLASLFIITALVAVIGGHWAILQSVAWTSMLAQNLQSGSVTEAVSKTFDGEHPCSLCNQIAEGRKSEKKSDPLNLKMKKIEMAFHESHFVFVQPDMFRLLPLLESSARFMADAPPVPPPRFPPA